MNVGSQQRVSRLFALSRTRPFIGALFLSDLSPVGVWGQVYKSNRQISHLQTLSHISLALVAPTFIRTHVSHGLQTARKRCNLRRRFCCDALFEHSD